MFTPFLRHADSVRHSTIRHLPLVEGFGCELKGGGVAVDVARAAGIDLDDLRADGRIGGARRDRALGDEDALLLRNDTHAGDLVDAHGRGA